MKIRLKASHYQIDEGDVTTYGEHRFALDYFPSGTNRIVNLGWFTSYEQAVRELGYHRGDFPRTGRQP